MTDNLTMYRLKLGFAVFVLACAFGCSQPKPTAEEVASARKANVLTRDIDKAHDVANNASERTDDPALH